MEETLTTTTKNLKMRVKKQKQKQTMKPKLACLVRLVKCSQNKQGEEKNDQDPFSQIRLERRAMSTVSTDMKRKTENVLNDSESVSPAPR